MRKLWIATGVVVALLVALAATLFVASEYSGEVVTATTYDPDGTPHETRLWITEMGEDPYLRGDSSKAWVQRLDEFAELELEWRGQRDRYQALPVISPGLTQQVEEKMAADYGWGDRLVSFFRSNEPTVAIRLTPLALLDMPEGDDTADSPGSHKVPSLSASVEALVLERRGARLEALPSLPGRGPQGVANGVSGDGKVVVGESGGEAYRWEAGTGLIGLGHLGAARGTRPVSSALAVSQDGSTVVGRSSSPEGVQAFRWKEGSLTGLGDLPGGAYLSIALGASADGSVVVGRSSSDNGIEAFRFENGTMTALGDLPGGAFESIATGVSADGKVVVGLSDSDRGATAFRWEGGVMTALQGPREVRQSRAMAVSADGSVIVGDCITTKGRLPFRWTRASNEMELLPELAPIGTDFDSGALAVSADGKVVAGSSFGRGDQKSGAFFWTQKEGMRGVQKVLVNDYLIEVSDWLFEATTALSSDGATLVGTAVDADGVSRSWTVRLPAGSRSEASEDPAPAG